MTTLTASEARIKLYQLVDRVASSHQPVQIVGKRNEAVLIAAEDWNAILETLHLVSIPGMRSAIRRGMKTPLKNCSKVLKW